jgi:hypothetical protein
MKYRYQVIDIKENTEDFRSLRQGVYTPPEGSKINSMSFVPCLPNTSYRYSSLECYKLLLEFEVYEGDPYR